MTGGRSSVRSVRFPAAYGTPGGPDSLLAWTYVEKRIRAASNYWITTVGPDARPHARPVDGVWVDGALCFGGSPETRWVRNLMANPSISAHLSSEAEAIILGGFEGEVPAVLLRDRGAIPAVLGAAPDDGLCLDARGLPARRHALALRIARRPGRFPGRSG